MSVTSHSTYFKYNFIMIYSSVLFTEPVPSQVEGDSEGISVLVPPDQREGQSSVFVLHPTPDICLMYNSLVVRQTQHLAWAMAAYHIQ